MGTLIIRELKIETIIGCLTWERQVKQPVIFDLEIQYDTTLAGVTDNLQDTVDYSCIAETITHFVENSQFKLIEALAAQTIKLIEEKFSISCITLTVTKLVAIPNAKSVSVHITKP